MLKWYGALIMKICFLLLGTNLSLIPSLTFAQCVATQDCKSLGYTETSCSGGSGVKCPFGNSWACIKSEAEIKDQLCTELGFTQTCTGTNQIGGASKTCNGKYNVCSCAGGYEWKDWNCQQLNGAKGELYYCNGGVKATWMNFYIAMKNLGSMSWSSANSTCQNYTFCDNVKGILPTKDQLVTIYNNKSQINKLLSSNCGTELTNSYYWSSTEAFNVVAFGYYIVNMSNGNIDAYYYDRSVNVRSIFASY